MFSHLKQVLSVLTIEAIIHDFSLSILPCHQHLFPFDVRIYVENLWEKFNLLSFVRIKLGMIKFKRIFSG
jgi:hypothetical protein